jgi:hypothetical protein
MTVRKRIVHTGCDLDPEKDLLSDGNYTSENGVG